MDFLWLAAASRRCWLGWAVNHIHLGELRLRSQVIGLMRVGLMQLDAALDRLLQEPAPTGEKGERLRGDDRRCRSIKSARDVLGCSARTRVSRSRPAANGQP